MPGYRLQPLLPFITPFQLTEGQNYLCGTGKADISLPHVEVSSKHCVFRAKSTGLQLEDLKSDSGTYVNGKKIDSFQCNIIKLNDIIGISNNQTQDIDFDKPYVFRLERNSQILEREEVGAKRKSNELSEIPNKKIKIENNDCELIDLTDKADDCALQEIHHKTTVAVKSDKEAAANPIKIEFKTPTVEEDQETDIDEDSIEYENKQQSSTPNPIIGTTEKSIESKAENNVSSTDQIYLSRKMIVYSTERTQKIQKTLENKTTSENQDQEEIPLVLNNKVQASVPQKSTSKTGGLESTESTSIKSAVIEKKTSAPIETSSSIDKPTFKTKQKNNSLRDLRNYLLRKNQEKEKNPETKSTDSSDKKRNQLESTSGVKKHSSDSLDQIVKMNERKRVQENSKSVTCNVETEKKQEKKKANKREKKLEVLNHKSQCSQKLKSTSDRPIDLQNNKEDSKKQKAVDNQSSSKSKDKSAGQSKEDNCRINETIEPLKDYAHQNLSGTSNKNNMLDGEEKEKPHFKNSNSSSTIKRSSIVHNYDRKIKILGIEALNAIREKISINYDSAVEVKNPDDSLEAASKTKDSGLRTSDNQTNIMAKVTAGTSDEQVVGSTDMQSSLSEEQELYNYALLLQDSDCNELLSLDLESDFDANSYQDDSTLTPKTVDGNFHNKEPTSLLHDQPNITESSDSLTLLKLDDYAQNLEEYRQISFTSDLPVGFLLSFLKWNPMWMDTYKKRSLICQRFENHTYSCYAPSYGNYKNYYSDMTVLILHELWAFIVHKISHYYKHKRVNVYINPKSITQTPADSNNNSLTVFEIIMTDTKYLSIGDLVILHFKLDSNSIKIFAYVNDCRNMKVNFPTTNNKFLKQFSLITGPLPPNVDYNRSCELTKVYTIRSFIRMAQGIEYLRLSPLKQIFRPLTAQAILPKLETANYDGHYFVTGDQLDDKQKETILQVTNAITEGSPKICLIDGPPGSGKSSIIVNIVTEIMNNCNEKNKKRNRILVCAPTNAAVDALTSKLIEICDKLKANHHYVPFRIVRVGRHSALHGNVDNVTFHSLAKRMNRKNILIEADVILSTLSSCCSYTMEFLFGKNLETISACIIDDAALCCEPESLIPLKLGIQQFVFVGDSKELPTSFFSEIVKDNSNHKSLLSRLRENLQFDDSNDPFIKLNAQYRISEEIFSWPNSYFYDGKIRTKVSYTNIWPLHNYKVFDYHYHDVNAYFNHEANFVINLVENINIFSPFNSISVGVFTYDMIKKKKFENLWNQRLYSSDYLCHRNGTKVTVEFITTDRVLRRQHDVIIMCCGRKKKSGFLTDEQLLYLLFTGVKYSLFIVGDFDSFKPDGIWKNLIQYSQQKNLYELVDYSRNADDVKYIIMKS